MNPSSKTPRKKLSQKERRRRNRECNARWRAGRPDYFKEYAAKHPTLKDYHRAYYLTHRQEIIKRSAINATNNPASVAAARRRYRERHAEEGRRYARQYAIDHKEEKAARAKRFWKSPSGKASSANNRSQRRARLKATVDPITATQLLLIQCRAKECFYCKRTGLKLTVDHFIPLSKGGEHSVKNIVMACGSCNSKKFNRDPREFIAWLAKHPPPQK